MLNFTKTSNEEEYKELVEKYYYLVDNELKIYEGYIINNEHHSIATDLPKLISLVNVVGYFRGQDGAFLNFRPSHLSIQNDLYDKENEFENRLRAIIEFVKISPSANIYKDGLKQYFIKARGFQED